ncbi:MAG: hypothetical protein AW07_04509 [Candidatus Accumulibacter sp. SK-11]|nr:MAG: hypothetical protein AW07_04509 [Candidatus Accumulibacter sp. SK-11]
MMRCAFEPPKPKELTPIVSLPVFRNGRLLVTSWMFQSAARMRGLTLLTPMVAGTRRCSRQCRALTRPATPDAVSR